MPKVLPSAPTPGGGRLTRARRVSATLAEINVIPLVDVMLVLLIIFMVAAPMLQRGVEVKLPVASRTQEISSERLFIDVPLAYRTDHRVFLGKEAVRVEVLSERMRQALLNRSDKQAYLRIDRQLFVQDQVDVMTEIKNAGILEVGMVLDLPTQ